MTENLLKIWPKFMEADAAWEKQWNYDGNTSLEEGIAQILNVKPERVLLSSLDELKNTLDEYLKAENNSWRKTLRLTIEEYLKKKR